MSNVNLSTGVFVHVCAYTYVCGLSMEVFMYIWTYLPMCPHIVRMFVSVSIHECTYGTVCKVYVYMYMCGSDCTSCVSMQAVSVGMCVQTHLNVFAAVSGGTWKIVREHVPQTTLPPSSAPSSLFLDHLTQSFKTWCLSLHEPC